MIRSMPRQTPPSNRYYIVACMEFSLRFIEGHKKLVYKLTKRDKLFFISNSRSLLR